MQQPGLSRAVPMGVLGFLFGALLVIVIRALQSLTPVWDVGVGIVFGTLFCAIFFVWGIGAFDPRLSVHGEDEEQHHAEAVAPPRPSAELTGAIWQMTFLLIVLIVALVAMAWLGPTLITTTINGANVRGIGMTPVQMFGQEMTLSYGVIFAGFVIFMLVSLGAAAAILSVAMTYLSRGLVEARAEAAGAPLPAPARQQEKPRPAFVSTLVFIALFVMIFVVLLALFYYVLIGLVLPGIVPGISDEGILLVSALNAFVFAVLILRPRWIIRVISAVARLILRILNALLGGKVYKGTEKPRRWQR